MRVVRHPGTWAVLAAVTQVAALAHVTVVQTALAVVMGAAVLVGWRHPLRGLVLAWAAYATLAALGVGDGGLAATVLLARAAWGDERWPWALVGNLLVLAGSTLAQGDAADAALVVLGQTAVAGVTIAIRQTRAARASARETALVQDRLDEAQRLAAVAREVHDIVGHGVMVMLLGVRGARAALQDAPADADAALGAVEAAGERAMAELRDVLAVLRPDAPVPGSGTVDVEALTAGVRGAGLQVDAQVDAGDLPPHVALVVQRVGQEALTNVIKHAGASRAALRIARDGDRVVVEVRDDGDGGAPGVGHGPGRGLPGLRERLDGVGGTLQAGPAEGRGWLVRAEVPL